MQEREKCMNTTKSVNLFQNQLNTENKETKKLFFSDGIGFIEMLDVFGDDLLVANAARVSFNKESAMEMVSVLDEQGHESVQTKLSNRDVKLIQYLAQHKHITPFFHPQVRLRIKMPLFVVREWYRHTVGFARNEVSRRYIDSEPECFVPSELRQRDPNLKQGSKIELVQNNSAVSEQVREYCATSLRFYRELLDKGVAPEQARMILPQSMYTEFIETGSLSAYARLVGLRVEVSAQKEIQEYGKMVSELIEPHFPVSWQALTSSKNL